MHTAKLDRVAPLVADPPHTNSTTLLVHTLLLGYGDHMVNQFLFA